MREHKPSHAIDGGRTARQKRRWYHEPPSCLNHRARRSGSGDWRVAVVLCVALLGLRSWFFLAWEESYFDSDQAIVGLMAKHLAEGRAKPLFFYGQEYMLAVEAWVSAPFIALFGTSVAALRARARGVESRDRSAAAATPRY